MITKLVLGFFFTLVDWVLTHIGSITLPSFFGTGSGSISDLFGNLVSALESMGNWIPVEVIGPCLVAITGFVTVGFTIRIVRIVISHVTGGGGSAA